MRLSFEMKAIIRNELLTDPAGRGYAGRKPEEIVKVEFDSPGSINCAFTAIKTPEATLSNQPVRWQDIRRAAQSTGEWPRIRRLSETRLPEGTPNDDPKQQIIDAAINATETDNDQVIDPSDPDAWGPFQVGLKAFRDAGVLSDVTINRISGLTTVNIPAVVEERHCRLWTIFNETNKVSLPDDFKSYELTAEDIKECLS